MESLQQQQAENIARAEMARRRRQLGNLTPEQEMNIETLLISTANKVSKMIAAMELKLNTESALANTQCLHKRRLQ